jgi:RimJ/RimL family protein N-acetyltransferase
VPRERARLALRAATARDAELLLEWRNDAETRRQSRTSSRVTAAAHTRWLAATLADPEIHLFIARDAEGRDVGTGRIDYRGRGTAELSLTVAPAHRRRGYAGAIIAALGAEADRLGWHTHVARIKETNPASLRAFRQAGFVSDGCIHFERRSAGVRRTARPRATKAHPSED